MSGLARYVTRHSTLASLLLLVLGTACAPGDMRPPGVGDAAPHLGPSMMARIRAETAPIDRSAPGTSSGLLSGSRLSGTRNRLAVIAIAAIGTFTRNTDPQ